MEGREFGDLALRPSGPKAMAPGRLPKRGSKECRGHRSVDTGLCFEAGLERETRGSRIESREL